MIVKAPVFNADTQKLDILEFRTDDARYDFSDPRVIRNVNQSATFEYLTSLSYIRVARSKDGHRFTIDDKPLVYPAQSLETFGIEDPRVTQIGETYYIYFSAVSPVGVGESMVSPKTL